MSTATARKIVSLDRRRAQKQRQTGGKGSGPDALSIMAHRGITFDDVRKLERGLLDAAQSGEEKSVRDLALFYFLICSALRVSEILSIRWKDQAPNDEGETGFIFGRLKKRQDRDRIGWTGPGPQAMAALESYRTLTGEKEYLFYSLPNRAKRNKRAPLSVRSVEQITSEWGRVYGIQTKSGRTHTHTGRQTRGLNPHAFRHTAIRKIAVTKGTLYAQRVAGHSREGITGNYLPREGFSTAGLWD